MASNTGCTSAGDWLMMRRMSDVAAWWSRAMRSSRLSCAIEDLDLSDLGLLAFDVGVLGLVAFGRGDLVFGIALVRLGAVVRFAAFRPRLAMFPPVEP